MSGKTILSCAVTGGQTKPEANPALPITPEQIANAAIEACKHGAAIAHIHVRDPDTGAPSIALKHYKEVVDRIRDSGSEVIINLTTGPGARFVPDPSEPRKAAAGTTLITAEERVEHVVELKPEICSLDLNTMFFGASVAMNVPEQIIRMAKLIHEAGVMPELEVFDSGDIQLAHHLIAEGVLAKTSLFQIVTCVKFGFDSNPRTLAYAVDQLPAGSNWAAFGIGRFEFPVVAHAWILGGHTRVGMEDNIYLKRGELTPGNTPLVQRAVGIIENLGGEVATPKEAREILGLG